MPLAKSLASMPSRGLLTAVPTGAAFSRAPAPYIADHNTSPPENQVIKTDPSSYLIRSLQARKPKEAPAKKGRAVADKGKRPASQPADAPQPAKRHAPGSDGAGPSSAQVLDSEAGPSTAAAATATNYTRAGLVGKTVKDLQAILRDLQLAVGGKKEELVTRILEKQNGAGS